MSFADSSTYYDVLDLRPDASPQEVREAYLRIKATYNRDSLALYTLVSTEEREEMLRKIEEAYDILSNPEKRRQYDRNHGLLKVGDDFQDHKRAHKKIISIDRVPPMEPAHSDDLLVPPSTDFGARQATPEPDSFFGNDTNPPPQAQPPSRAPSAPAPASIPAPPPVAPPRIGSSHPIIQEIAAETEWHGIFLKKVRESQRLSIEEMSAITKISKGYLQALESEDFVKLPAPVFVRGFVTQISKVLKLPSDKVATAYMLRYNHTRAAGK